MRHKPWKFLRPVQPATQNLKNGTMSTSYKGHSKILWLGALCGVFVLWAAVQSKGDSPRGLVDQKREVESSKAKQRGRLMRYYLNEMSRRKDGQRNR